MPIIMPGRSRMRRRGRRSIERLKTLYTLTHLRGRLHVTLRDLGSALAYMLVGTRNCPEIHTLYQTGERDQIIQGFYFNSWMAGDESNGDRLLTLLKDVDVGRATDPRLDRALDFVSRMKIATCSVSTIVGPTTGKSFVACSRSFRGISRAGLVHPGIRPTSRYVPLHVVGASSSAGILDGKACCPTVRRSGCWRLFRARTPGELVRDILDGINRGEGLTNPRILARQSRTPGTRGGERLNPQLPAFFCRPLRIGYPRRRDTSPVRRASPLRIAAQYRGDRHNDAELLINLDVFEMLQRLNGGYRPSVEEEQGYYLSLAVFKNVLGSAPYQDVLLTTTVTIFSGSNGNRTEGSKCPAR